MIQNIAITGFDRELLKKVGKALAEKLEMFYVDTIELYEFDHLPHTLSDMIKAQGLKEFRNKEVGTIGYVTEFNNAVITFEPGAVKRQKNIKKVKENCELVYLFQNLNVVKEKLVSVKYPSVQVKKLFDVSVKTLEIRNKILLENSDVIIDSERKSPKMIANEIFAKLQKKYL